MSKPDYQQAARSAMNRRFAAGSLVAALVFGALVILVAVNWIAVRLVDRHGAALRIDVTSTRKYTLSEQTRNILADLDDEVVITTVFADAGRLDPDTARKITDFRDLITEYSRRSGGKVRAQHVPATDPAMFKAFADELLKRFGTQVDEAKSAVASGVDAMNRIAAIAAEQSQRAAAAAQQFGATDPGLHKQLTNISAFLKTRADELRQAAKNPDFDTALARPLPGLSTVIDGIKPQLSTWSKDVIAPLIEFFDGEAKADDVPQALGFFFRDSLKAFRDAEQVAAGATDQLEALDLDDYNSVQRRVQAGDSAVVMTPTDQIVISLADVYTETYDPDAKNPAPDTRFRGEEAVTGAIVSLTLEQAPMVVFVTTQPQPVTPEGGLYHHVAERLKKMNFDVQEWNPVGRQSPFGGPPIPQPRPKPAEGQPIVWVVLPAPPLNPMAPGSSGAVQQQQALRSIIDDGDPVLVVCALSAMSTFGQADPSAEAVADLGVGVDSGKMLLVEMVDQQGKAFPVSEFSAYKWDTDHPVGKALDGQAVMLRTALPLTIDAKAGKAWPLLTTPANAWAETRWMDRESLPRRGADEAGGPFVVAAAIEADTGRRAVVVGDEALGTDQTIMGQQMVLTGEGLKTIRYVNQPGNAELFANSIYWLAGHEELIATGARSQDVRKFGPVGTPWANTTRWLLVLGVPALCIIVGAVVWLARRS